jgi:phosphoglycolate phosphatase
VLDLLAELKRQGKAVGVVSNKADFAVKKLCAAYFGELVDVAIGENEMAGIAKKPAPDTIFAALDKLGIAVGNALYVGDSEVDIQTAAAAKIPCISVTWGMKNEQFLRENGAKNIVFSVEDLQKMI